MTSTTHRPGAPAPGRRPRRARAAGAAAVAAAAWLAGCSVIGPGDAGPGEDGGPAAQAPAPGVPPEWAAAVEKLEERYDARIGVALSRPGAAVDADGRAVGRLGPDLAGDLDVGYAWSTAKVPIAVAYRRATGEVDGTVEAALTVSDNDAASAMWDALGGGAASREAVDEVLADAGDARTHMQTSEEGVYNGVFGMTDWSAAAQSVVGANLPCIEGGRDVYAVMGEISEDQSYGLGRIRGAHFKGGWAPDPATGAYLVRQLGVVPAFGNGGDAADGDFAGVAVVVEPEDGSYGTGMAVLDDLAGVIAAHPPLGGRCPAGGGGETNVR